MKVLVLTTILAPYRIDYFNELGRYCNLTVCFEKRSETGRNETWYKKDLLNFRAVRLKRWDKSQSRIRTDILSFMKNGEYDIAVAFEYSTPTAVLFMLVNLILGKRYCINVDGAFISDDKLKSVIKRFFIVRAGGCFASGQMAAKYLKHYGASNEQIHYHNFTSLFKKDIVDQPLSQDEKFALRTRLGIPLKKTAISVGQFIHRKGFDILIKAWEKVDLDYNLLLVGGGEKEREYVQLIKLLNLGNVTVLGFKRREELAEYYSVADLFILPSREDIWGLVINEAMAFGLPVITTNKCVAGLELINDYENGFVVPVEQVDILAQRIEEILSDERLAISMATANLDRIRPYTIENMARQHFETLRQIVDGNL